MGRILRPPKDLHYPHPKAVGPGYETARIIGRAMCLESFPSWGDYMRVLDLVRWEKDGHKEIRFCQYFRKAGGTDSDWIFGQGAGHMKVETFYELIHKAKTNPDYGVFENIFDKL
ncbi:MAG: hypothetical protein AAB767_04080 [Patescibacteria group bacterium]